MSNDPRDWGNDTRNALNLAVFLSLVHAFFAEVWLRKPGTCGSRFFGVQGLAALLWVPFFGVLVGAEDLSLYYFVAASLAWMVVHNVKRVVNEARGEVRHSLSKGEPWLPGGEGAYSTWEPVAAFLAGLAFLACGAVSLGAYLLSAPLALGMNQAVLTTRDKSRMRQVRDREIEQRAYQEMAKKERGDPWR